MTSFFEGCRYDMGPEEVCPNQGFYLVAWQPAYTDEEGQEINPEDTTIVLGEAMSKTNIPGTWTIVCDQHHQSQIDMYKSYTLPEDAQVDWVFSALLCRLSIIERPVPERVEVLEFKPEENSEKAEEEDAPYGRRVDGTPRKKPGRKAVAKV